MTILTSYSYFSSFIFRSLNVNSHQIGMGITFCLDGMNDFTDSKWTHFIISVLSENFHTKFICEKSGSRIWISEYKAWKRRWMCEKGDILRNHIIVGSDVSQITTHMVSPITRHCVWNIFFSVLWFNCKIC